MATIQLTQDKKDISNAIKNLMAMSGTNLTKVCEKHSLDYIKTYKLINSKKIDLDFLREFTLKVNPKTKFKMNIHLDMTLEGSTIFNQENK